MQTKQQQMNVQTGVLELKIIEAKVNKGNTKLNGQSLIKIFYNGNYYRTRPSNPSKDSYAPAWNHMFNIPIFSAQQNLTLTLTSCEDNVVMAEANIPT